MKVAPLPLATSAQQTELYSYSGLCSSQGQNRKHTNSLYVFGVVLDLGMQ